MNNDIIIKLEELSGKILAMSNDISELARLFNINQRISNNTLITEKLIINKNDYSVSVVGHNNPIKLTHFSSNWRIA